jgi:hypothetical protein
MNQAERGNEVLKVGGSWKPAGEFLDLLPKGLYAVAHLMFLAVGAWLWLRASDNALPYSGALALYVVSQVGFLAYFANAITMKMAVLIEQSLVFAMLLIIVLRAT